MKVLFAASEIFPHAKSGGLADVANALPHALKDDVTIVSVMPLYGFMDKEKFKHERGFDVDFGGMHYRIELYYELQDNLKTYFIQAPLLSATENLYCDKDGDYPNNDLRFALFSAAVVELAIFLQADILHLNDWHTALAALFVRERKLALKTVFTIHNLAYQGVFEKDSLGRLGLHEEYYSMEKLEFYGKINFLKAGVLFSDYVTTVSPSYAKEIMTEEYGCGLDGFLKFHKKKISGVLNGINDAIFDPSKDENLYLQFDGDSLGNKYKNKTQFIKDSTLKDPRKPLFIMVTRLVEQKGVDLILESLEELLAKNINLFILGEGSREYIEQFETYAQLYPNLEFYNGYDESLSHKTYAAADFLLMPSKFEPCGLNQMIAIRYGTIPIVHAVGGLKDSVHEEKTECGNGISFKKYSKKALLLAVERALKLKKDTKKFKSFVKYNMACDFSFGPSAQQYMKIYKKIK